MIHRHTQPPAPTNHTQKKKPLHVTFFSENSLVQGLDENG